MSLFSVLALTCISLEMRRTAVGGLSLRVAERRGMEFGDVEKTGRAVSDAQHVQWHEEQSAH